MKRTLYIVTETRFFFCPRKPQIMELDICQARKKRRKKGCMSCPIGREKGKEKP